MKEKSFFKWLIKKWHFWVLSVGWSAWSYIDDIMNGNYIEFIFGIIGWGIFVILIYFIIFYIINKISKYIKKEIDSRLKK